MGTTRLHGTSMFSFLRSESDSCSVCLTPCDSMDCSPPGSSVHGILKARILEWVAICFSRASPDPGIEPRSPALQADSLPSELAGKPFLRTCQTPFHSDFNVTFPSAMHTGSNYFLSCQHFVHSNF